MYILMLLLMVVRDMSSLVKFDWTYSATTSPDNMKNEFKQRVSSYLAGQSCTYLYQEITTLKCFPFPLHSITFIHPSP